jgi:hypothetical protein
MIKRCLPLAAPVLVLSTTAGAAGFGRLADLRQQHDAERGAARLQQGRHAASANAEDAD